MATSAPFRTVVAGDSAGGWLALTAALRLRDEGSALPAAVGLVSPWLGLSGPERYAPPRPDAAAGLDGAVRRGLRPEP